MPLIKKDVLLGIADRIAMQYKLLKEAMEAGALGKGYNVRINETADVDVQIPLLAPSVSVDQSYLIDNLVRSYRVLNEIVTSMENHFAKMGVVGSWDGYLASKDARVSEYFNRVYETRGSGPLLAMNVFCEKEMDFATVVIKDNGLDYEDGDDFGPGMNPSLRADGRNFAPQQLGIHGNFTAPIDLIVSAKDWEGDVYDVTVSIPAGTEFMPIGNADNRFMDVVSVSLPPDGQKGNPGDSFKIKNIKEREIRL